MLLSFISFEALTTTPGIVIATLAVALGLLYWYATLDFGKYEALGLPAAEKPRLFFGNVWDVITGKRHIMNYHLDLYRKFAGHK